MTKTYRGSCHCGNIAFEVEGELTGALACNCSICARKGSLLWFVPRDKLRLTPPKNPVGTYTFQKHLIKHHFCQTCVIPLERSQHTAVARCRQAMGAGAH